MSVKIRTDVGLSFDDVLLVPQKGKVKSRNDVRLSTHLGGDYWLANPIVASPMSTVCDSVLARRLSELGGIGIIHRFMSIEQQVSQWKVATKSVGIEGDVYAASTHWAGCAIGVNEKTKSKTKTGSYQRVEQLWGAGCRLFGVDVAHGHSEQVSGFMGNLSADILRTSTFISGSIATGDAARFCAKVGFDTVRVGIGNGSACSTRSQTGHGVPQLTALMEVAEALDGVKSKNGTPVRIISCGGIRNGSDAVKAIAAGASTVMLGQYLAGADESPQSGQYSGQASLRAKEEAGQSTDFIEGESGTVRNTGSLESTISPLLSGIRSGISYSGARNIIELQEKAEFIVTAPGVQNESKVRL